MAREQLNTLLVLVGQRWDKQRREYFAPARFPLHCVSIPAYHGKIWDFISHENVLYIFML